MCGGTPTSHSSSAAFFTAAFAFGENPRLDADDRVVVLRAFDAFFFVLVFFSFATLLLPPG